MTSTVCTRHTLHPPRNAQPLWTALVDNPNFLAFVRCSVADGSLNDSAGGGLQDELLSVFIKVKPDVVCAFVCQQRHVTRCRRRQTLILARIKLRPSRAATRDRWSSPTCAW